MHRLTRAYKLRQIKPILITNDAQFEANEHTEDVTLACAMIRHA